MKYKYKILIVDEQDKVLATLKKYLEQEGYKVETTQSAAEAFEKIKSDKYHIVLIDIAMPEIDGLQLLREIKKYDPMTQIIMMTENSTMDKILSSLEYGANDYINEPLKSTEYVISVIDYSVQKLERWRAAIIQIVK
ncbi:response regulator [Clostridium estertheticum]|uniref:response regulator n=1 Tax=Clostridium estertheticum TaxID=238834 RepID=UPI001CF4CBAE|nr:response regulator [Clostridium estertheticum]MCB2306203.1 response regulator [Clostridium estertheticum]MCB2344376.1 response regulator [Clostridium estertheticum]MCB2349295.1 response regulator [Clostridium estertheticum]WAG45040.1 response regulator [Clostridium estertheticum]